MAVPTKFGSAPRALASRGRPTIRPLVCDTIYGDRLTLDTSFQEVPTINGKPLDYAPPKVLEGPFLNADYNSAVVTIRRGERCKVLDFN